LSNKEEDRKWEKPPWTPPVPPEELGNYKERKESVVNSFLDGLIYFLEGFRQN
jgi:hypothetical protein